MQHFVCPSSRSSCKCRGFCPSCTKRKSFDLAVFLEEDLRNIEELFRALVLKLLINEGMLSPNLAEKMRGWKHTGFSIYRGEHYHPALGRNFEITDPLELIARSNAHIPRKGAKQVIYYGSYSQAWRGSAPPTRIPVSW